jgi:hypothetical protein
VALSAWDLSRIPLFPANAPAQPVRWPEPLTPRLIEIGEPNDPLEHEADRVADEVMRCTAGRPALGAAVQLSRKCAAC